MKLEKKSKKYKKISIYNSFEISEGIIKIKNINANIKLIYKGIITKFKSSFTKNFKSNLSIKIIEKIDKDIPIKLIIINVNIVPKLLEFELFSILSIKYFKQRKPFTIIINPNNINNSGIDKYNQLNFFFEVSLIIKRIKNINEIIYVKI